MEIKKKGYTVSDIYQGGYSTLSPSYGESFTGYRPSSTGLIGTPTAPPGQQGDLLANLQKSIATGQKVVELSLLNPEIVDAIPKQHLKETKRMAKVTGVDLSVHGPLVEPSGIHEGRWNESSQKSAERQIFRSLEASHEIDPKGNINVTIHTSNGPPGIDWKKTKKGEEEFVGYGFDEERKQIVPLEKDTEFYPRLDPKTKKVLERTRTPEDRLRALNSTQWIQSISNLATPKEQADRIISETGPIVNEILKVPGMILEAKTKEGEIVKAINHEALNNLTPTQQQVWSRYNNAHLINEEISLQLQSLFDKAYKYGSDIEKRELKKIAEKAQELVPKSGAEFQKESQYNQFLIENLQRFNPQQYKRLDKWLIEKSSDTFANAALKSYKKFGEDSPTLTIENPPVGMALSRGKEVKELVEQTRKNFIEKATKSKSEEGLGMSEDQAKRAAEKFIGVTWDVGHINQLRKHGFSGKDTVKEAEQVKHLVKHIHLSDNFGSENTELPPGMGNVEFEKVMKKLGKSGEKAKKIVEAAHWVIHQKSSPYAQSLQGLGSPIYAMHMQPYWNQSRGFQQGYFTGYGQMLPQINYETFGAGWSQLPSELGGQRPGAGGSRMSGRGME